MVREMSLHDALQRIVSLVVEFTNSDSCLLYLLQSQKSWCYVRIRTIRGPIRSATCA